jgi:predicted RNA-binding Zn-ribbon protein involved in translation (DUF1610 family)
MSDVRTLILDLETQPTSAFVWGLWDQRVGLNQIVEPGKIISWAAAWAGSDEVEYSSINITSHKKMIWEIWKLLDEADEAVGWNSNSFDLKLLNAAFAVYGFGPPSPYKRIDLMRTVKSQMKFISNKLDFVSGQFGVGHKMEHEGFGLWVRCMNGEQEAWDLMHAYNIEDVLLTERMYDKLRGWIHNGVNRSTVTKGFVCPSCGSSHLHSRGKAVTTTLTYARFQCQDCGTWSRERIAEKQPEKTKLVLAR